MERRGNVIDLTPAEQQAGRLPVGIRVDSAKVVYDGLSDRIDAFNQICRDLSAPSDYRTGRNIIQVGKLAAASGMLSTLNSMQTQLRELVPEQFESHEVDSIQGLLLDWSDDIDPALWNRLSQK